MSEGEIEDAVGSAVAAADESSEVQRRLLDAAEACFAQFGLRKTTMEDVARSAGMSRATVYRHFENRDDLLMSVVEREAHRVKELLRARLRGVEHPGDYIIEGILLAPAPCWPDHTSICQHMKQVLCSVSSSAKPATEEDGPPWRP